MVVALLAVVVPHLLAEVVDVVATRPAKKTVANETMIVAIETETETETDRAVPTTATVR